MNVTAISESKLTSNFTTTILNFETVSSFQSESRHLHLLEPVTETSSSDLNTELSERILTHPGGDRLIKYCREFANNLIRCYMIEEKADGMHEHLCAGVCETLGCNPHQAQCIVDLSLELIHVKAHGSYFQNKVDLNYLIASGIEAVTSFLGLSRN